MRTAKKNPTLAAARMSVVLSRRRHHLSKSRLGQWDLELGACTWALWFLSRSPVPQEACEALRPLGLSADIAHRVGGKRGDADAETIINRSVRGDEESCHGLHKSFSIVGAMHIKQTNSSSTAGVTGHRTSDREVVISSIS